MVMLPKCLAGTPLHCMVERGEASGEETTESCRRTLGFHNGCSVLSHGGHCFGRLLVAHLSKGPQHLRQVVCAEVAPPPQDLRGSSLAEPRRGAVSALRMPTVCLPAPAQHALQSISRGGLHKSLCHLATCPCGSGRQNCHVALVYLEQLLRLWCYKVDHPVSLPTEARLKPRYVQVDASNGRTVKECTHNSEREGPVVRMRPLWSMHVARPRS